MTFVPPEGYVDPANAAEVSAVLEVVQRVLGVPGVVDLLGRLPGARLEPGRASGLFRAAVPASISLSPEHRIELSDPPVHVHVVGGIVLTRDQLPAGRLAQSIARLLVATTAENGTHADASVVLTAARETAEPL